MPEKGTEVTTFVDKMIPEDQDKTNNFSQTPSLPWAYLCQGWQGTSQWWGKEDGFPEESWEWVFLSVWTWMGGGVGERENEHSTLETPGFW